MSSSDLRPFMNERRSMSLLFVVIGLATLAAIAAKVVRPPTGPQVSPTGGIRLPVEVTESTPNSRVLRDQLIEQLVSDARSEPRPTLLPAYESLAIPCRRNRPACDQLIERLLEPDVPLALLAAFASELPESATKQLDSLLLPLLRSDDESKKRIAADTYRAVNRAAMRTSPNCHCGFGVLPMPLTEEAWLVAESPTGGALGWNPHVVDGGYVLDLERRAEGPSYLFKSIEVTGPLHIQLRAEGIQLVVKEMRDGTP